MSGTPVWAQVTYVAAAVCFILALKGLSSPRHARRGNLVGAVGAVVACVVVFAYGELRHVAPIVVAIVLGSAVGLVGARRVQMTQMPQLVALFNGVGGGAAALVALLELADVPSTGVERFTLAATAFTILVGSVSFAGSLVTFAKLQELMTSRPVVFPGLPSRSVPPWSRRSRSATSPWTGRAPGRCCSGACCWRWSDCSSACSWCCRSAAPTSPS